MDVKLPQLAEGVESGTVVSILVAEGQEVKKDQPFMELETQKAVGSIPAPSAGVVTKIHDRVSRPFPDQHQIYSCIGKTSPKSRHALTTRQLLIFRGHFVNQPRAFKEFSD